MNDGPPKTELLVVDLGRIVADITKCNDKFSADELNEIYDLSVIIFNFVTDRSLKNGLE